MCLHCMGLCEHECIWMSAVVCLSWHTWRSEDSLPCLSWPYLGRFLLFCYCAGRAICSGSFKGLSCLYLRSLHRSALGLQTLYCTASFHVSSWGSNSGLLSCTASNKFIFLAQYLHFYPFLFPIWIALVFFIPIFLFGHQLKFSSFILYMNGASIGPHLMWAYNKGCINV